MVNPVNGGLDQLVWYVKQTVPEIYDDSLSHYELLQVVIGKLNTQNSFTNDVKDTLNALINQVNSQKWIDEQKIGDKQITRRVIQDGAVGVTQLDPNIVKQPSDTVGIQAKFSDLDKYNALNGINVKMPMVDGLTPAKGDGVTDDTNSLQAIINYANLNKLRVYVPSGTFIHSGLIIPKDTYLYGSGRTKTILKNISANPNLTLHETNISIRDIGIFGNGTVNYGTDATTGEGILIDGTYSTGASYIEINNCDISYNGKEGIKFYGGCWVINITKNNIGRNKLDGVKCERTDTTINTGQKNNINFSMNEIQKNGKNGLFVWGTNINIKDNSIEGNADAGVSMDNDQLTYKSSDVNGTSIEGNYFEGNGLGHIYVKVGTYTNPSVIYRTIMNLRIVGNYGLQNVTLLKNGLIASVNFINVGYTSDNLKILGLHYANNNFTLTNYVGYYIADFGNSLAEGCVIQVSDKSLLYYQNLGRAIYLGIKQKVINGYFHAKGINYTDIKKSDNVPDQTNITFPLDLPSETVINNIKLFVDTDSTNYQIKFWVFRRSITDVGGYSASQLISNATANGNGRQLLSASDPAAFGGVGRLLTDNADAYLQIQIIRTVPGTYLYIGHPIVYYSH
ncbi:MAG: hypothetical protein HF308_17095 [Ignavibacteria bacterium]|jgi:hypothetical protein|nr:hypothetical protein [Ignavibacteria bacterium]